MNKILLLVFFSSTSFAAFSQTQSGGMMVGGNVSYFSVKDDDATYKSYSLSPSFGYFVSNNIVIGVNVSMGGTVNTIPGSTTRTTGFGLGPFARFYKVTSNPNFAFYIEGALSFSSGRTNNEFAADTKSSSVSVRINPGFSYFFTKHWAADLAIRGLVIRRDNEENNANDQTVVDFGIGTFVPSLGLYYYFGNN